MKIFKRLIFILVILFLGYIVFCIIVFFNMPVKVDKNYDVVIIDNELVEADYKIFINIPEEYSALEQIEFDLRIKVAEYMKDHGLKLSDGEQKFNRICPTYDELISDFKFSIK